MEHLRLAEPLVSFSLLLRIGMLLLLQYALFKPISSQDVAAYHTLDVAASLRGIDTGPSGVEHKRETKPRLTSWSVQVLHRDTLPQRHRDATNAPASYEHWLEEKMRRDAARVRGLQALTERRLASKEPLKSYNNVAGVAAEFGGEVVSGLEQGSGEYFTRIGVGTPMTEQYMVLDTGSDVVWIQCQPCRECYSQVDPIFNPSFSASFSTVSCDSTVCSHLDSYDCQGGDCVYEASYGDGSHSAGSFAIETLTFGTTLVHNVAIGCGHDNVGLFVGVAGLLGLGAGILSFTTQLGTQTGRRFSYCLVDRESESSGTLEFGPESVPVESILTPLQTNPYLPTFYYLSLTAVSVGGVLVDSIPPRRLPHGSDVRPWWAHRRLRHRRHAPPYRRLQCHEGRLRCGHPPASESRGHLHLRHLLRFFGPTIRDCSDSGVPFFQWGDPNSSGYKLYDTCGSDRHILLWLCGSHLRSIHHGEYSAAGYSCLFRLRQLCDWFRSQPVPLGLEKIERHLN